MKPSHILFLLFGLGVLYALLFVLTDWEQRGGVFFK
jgi:hypothetical protein